MYDYELKHLETVRAGLPECTVLLKKNGQFPLGTASTIALYGSGVRKTVKGGTGSGEVNSRFFINIEEGFEKAGFTVTSKEWLDKYDGIKAEAHKAFIKDIKKKARAQHTMAIFCAMGTVEPEPEYEIPITKDCDTALYVIARNSGEGNDRKVQAGDVLLTNTEVRDILKLQEMYEKFMLVLNTGGPVDLSPVVDKVHNILVLSQLGVETGSALASIVLGSAYPSGKLTTTWAAAGEYCNVGDFGDPLDTYYKEGIYVGYRYFDSTYKTPIFPFGYGLSYSEFEFGATDVVVNGTEVTVEVKVKNTGIYPGKEVAEIYLSCPEGKLDKPFKQLAAFGKTKELKPGEETTLSVSFKMEDQTSYDEETASYILEKGSYIVRLGASSRDTKIIGKIDLPETVTVSKAKNVFGKPEFEDWKPETKINPVAPEDVKTVTLDPNAFVTKEFNYEPEVSVDPGVIDMPTEDLAYFAIGNFSDKGGVGSIIGQAGTMVAGAAGESNGRLKEQGIGAFVMADGPAGLRLSKNYYEDEGGAHTVGDGMIESMKDYMPWIAKVILPKNKAKKGVEVKEQYCTAIPIGTAIAQSFNVEFAEECGDIVGDEMERFNVDLWLAPALNIHRSILCGRNFEYYSEDPYVSGVFAAAITNGVQKHKGKGTTIKHFAANNQETNRYNNNGHVSERAMREIYLRGFEICIRESNPMAIMSSYNLINGIHTSEHKGLTTDILRCEWGYDNLVMTDWVIGGGSLYNVADRPIPNAGKVVAAGGDMFMPGCRDDYNRMLAEIDAGRLTRKQLEISASRVFRLIK